jgi:radical SAM superfamily enzyme YgiQ (UPF0313 family)
MYIASYAKKKIGNTIDIRIMDLSFEELTPEYLATFRPNIVGLRGLNNTAKYVKQTAALIKQFDRNIVVIAGGPYISADYAEALKDNNIDYGVVGEGEIAFTRIVECLMNNQRVEGIDNLAVYSEDEKRGQVKKISQIEDLDSLPFPAYKLINQEMYARLPGRSKTRRKQGILVSSRGCPYHCIYCHDIMGKKARLRSAKNLFDEVLWLNKEFGIKDFAVVDDIFNIDLKRAFEFYRLVIESGLKINICHHVGFRADIATKELLDAAKEAGVVMINFGLESAVPRIQKLIRKNLNLEKFERNVRYSSEIGIIAGIFTMGGFPTETFEEVCATIDFMKRFKKIVLPIFFIVNYHPGTELFNLALASGFDEQLLREDYESGYFSTKIGTPTITPKQFIALKTKYLREVLFSRERLLNAEEILKRYMNDREICDFCSTFLGKKVTDVRRDVYDYYN